MRQINALIVPRLLQAMEILMPAPSVIFLLFIGFSVEVIPGQELTWLTLASATGENPRLGDSIAVDGEGNSYVAGFFCDTTTFGPGEPSQVELISAGGGDIFVAKYDRFGSLLWATQAGGTASDSAVGIAVDMFGNSYVTGFFGSGIGKATATFGPGESNQTVLTGTSPFGGDTFIAKYDSSGSLLWTTQAGGTGITMGEAIAVDGQGNSYVTGYFGWGNGVSTATFGSGEINQTVLTSVTNSFDIFVAKYDTKGALVWAKRTGGPDFDRAFGIAVDEAGSSYVTGMFGLFSVGASTAHFGPGEANETTLTSAGSSDIFVGKYGNSGELVWVTRAGGAGTDWGEAIAVYGVDNTYVSGSFQDTATFGPGEAGQAVQFSSGGADAFVAKYDNEGSLRWVTRAGGPSDDWSSGIAVDEAGNGYVTGFFGEFGTAIATATFGEGEANQTVLTSAGSHDISVAKFDSSGALVWATRAGGEGSDRGLGIAADAAGKSYVTGFFQGTAIFGGEGNRIVLTSGHQNVFVAQYASTAGCVGSCPPDGEPSSPELTVTPGGLFFTLASGSPADARILTVTNTSAGPLSFNAEATTVSGGGWLTVSAESGTLDPSSSATLAVLAVSGARAPGTYSGRITVRTSPRNEVLTVPVTMSVSSSQARLLLSQTGLSFQAVSESGAPLKQPLRVLNGGLGSLTWSVAALTLDGGDWLRVTPAAGVASPAEPAPGVEVSANPAGLDPGEYHGQLQVVAPQAENSPQFVSVVLSLPPPDQDLGLVLDPTGLIFIAQKTGETPSQTFVLVNPNDNVVEFTLTADFGGGTAWFTLSVAGGGLSPGEAATVEARPATVGLTSGVYRGKVSVQSTPGDQARELELLLIVPTGAPAALTGTPRVAQGSGSCLPTRLLPVFTRLGNNFEVKAGWPSTIEITAYDDCGISLDQGSVVATFSNGDAALSLIALGEGRWSGTWASRGADFAEVVVTGRAVRLNPFLEGTTQIGGRLQTDSETPIIGAGAILNAASFAQQEPLAPGSLVSIFGQRLASGPRAAEGLPLATSLEGTQVLIAGRAMPLLFVSEHQVNAMIPYGIPANTRHQVVLRRGNRFTVPEPVSLASGQPAVFTKEQTGKGQGIIVTADGRLADEANPVRAGDVIVIYSAGLGELLPAVVAGSAVPSDPLSWTANSVSVMIGGKDALVLFAGATPGFTGLYQVNAAVPTGLPSANAVEVVLGVEEQFSSPVAISVRE